jgi:phage protein D
MTDTEALLASSAPVFEVDGVVHGELARDLVYLEVEETVDGLKTLRARLLAFGPTVDAAEQAERLQYLDGAVLDFGKPLVVEIGPPAGARTIFRGAISAIDASFEEAQEPEVVVFAEDRLMDMRMARRMRTYEDVTDAEIAEQIASEHGLAAEVDADGPRYDVVQQWNQSDLAFLRDRGRRVQAEVALRSETLHFQQRDRRDGTEITLVRGNHLLSVRLCADLAHQRTAVHVSGYDAQGRESIDEQADEDVVRAEAPTGRTGPAVLGEAFGPRVSHRVRDVPLNSEEAAEWARAEMLRRSRRFVQVWGTTRGTPEMVVGSRLTLERVGGPFAGGGYYATRVRHTYSLREGHRTCFEAERATVEEM